MKPSFTRRYRRRSSSSIGARMFKKDTLQEQAFFSAPSNQSFFKPSAAVQRKCADCEAEDKHVKRMSAPQEEEKKMHKKEEDKELHRSANSKEKEEEKKIQKRGNKEEEEKKVHLKEANSSISDNSSTGTYISSLHSRGQALPAEAQHFFGKRMGSDFSDVKIHTGTEAEQSAKDVHAKAYTIDNHIVFNKGEYDPDSAQGKKLLAHELAHVIQNNNGASVNRKVRTSEHEEEKSITINGSSGNVKNKRVQGHCEGVDVHGQTDFNPVPSTFAVQGGTTRPATACEECTPPGCITAHGTIVSVFRSNPAITLPSVPGGLTPCETNAVRMFINTTLRNHEQQHVTAFKTYDGTVRTPLNYKGCRSGLEAHVQSVHDGIDAQRSAAAIAQSDALDPFVRTIPCNCP